MFKHTIRDGHGDIKEVETNPLGVIREMCLACSGASYKEVKECVSKLCPLHPYRLGKNTGSKRVVTDEIRAERSERCKLMWSKRKSELVDKEIDEEELSCEIDSLIDKEDIDN